MSLDRARAKKENQKNSQRGALLNGPLSAAQRTQCAYKHKCIHCGGWCPCDPETLAAWSTEEGDGAPGTDAPPATMEAGAVPASDTLPLVAVDESADVALEEEWRDEVLKEA